METKTLERREPKKREKLVYSLNLEVTSESDGKNESSSKPRLKALNRDLNCFYVTV